jgi:hypothetical protein
MGIQVKYARLDKKLQRLKRRMSPFGQEGYILLVAGIHQYLQAQAQKMFDSEGASSPSGRWAPLRPRTQEIRARMNLPGIGGAHPINRRTNDLMDMMTREQPEIASSGGDLILLFPGNKAIARRNRRTKIAQAQGGYHGGTARPVVQFGPDDLAKVIVMANRFFGEVV